MKTRITALLIVILAGLSASGAEYKREIFVNPDGSGDFATFGESFEAIRAYMDYDVVVHLAPGVYKEKVVVPSWIKNVTIVGEDPLTTIITWDDYAGLRSMGTFRTYTVRVDADNVTFKNITFENSAGPVGQAVALHTEGDNLSFINCRFLGNQDTIFTGGEYTTLYFDHCYIEGTTDFIFGAATAVFDNCEIFCKSNSYITAASTPADVEYGYVLIDCDIKADPKVDNMKLGRPWRPYAGTLFINCNLDAPISPEGWHNWNNPDNEKTARYGEAGSTGRNGDMSRRAGWAKRLTDEEVARALYLRDRLAGK